MRQLYFITLSIFLYFSSTHSFAQLERHSNVEEQQLVEDNFFYVAEVTKELKEKVVDRKLQLRLLQELISREKLDTEFPLLKIGFLDDMSDRYRLQSLTYYIDNSKVFSFFRDDKDGNLKLKDFRINLAPGEHNLKVVAEFLGNDTGVFSYLSDFKVRTEMLDQFQVVRGKNLNLRIKAFEKGNIFTDFKEKPALKIVRK
ncbi:MAG: hypothetical protein AB8E15_10995 [Bdellovibrionales bacterium]